LKEVLQHKIVFSDGSLQIVGFPDTGLDRVQVNL